MNMQRRKSNRKIRSKVETSVIETTKKWSEDDIEKYIHCISLYGHKNLSKLQECFPAKSTDVLKNFLRTAFDSAIRNVEGHPNIDAWIHQSQLTGASPAWKDSMQIAQVIKYLSVDGLLENHPLPSQSQGINFSEAYRVLHQALMGYPIQPINEPTADFILQTFRELAAEAVKEQVPTENVCYFIKKNSNKSDENTMGTNSSKKEKACSLRKEKPLRVYQRKKPKLSNQIPSLEIVVEQNNQICSVFSATRDFSVTIKGSDNTSSATVLNIPVPVKMETLMTVDKNEQELLQSLSYNPFKIPENWLKEPFYVNLLLKQ